MKKLGPDTPIRIDHLASSIVQEIDGIACRSAEVEKKKRPRLGYEAERVRYSEVQAWLRKSAGSDLREYAQGTDDGGLIFCCPTTDE